MVHVAVVLLCCGCVQHATGLLLAYLFQHAVPVSGAVRRGGTLLELYAGQPVLNTAAVAVSSVVQGATLLSCSGAFCDVLVALHYLRVGCLKKLIVVLCVAQCFGAST